LWYQSNNIRGDKGEKKIAIGILVCFSALFVSCTSGLGIPLWITGTWESESTGDSIVFGNGNIIYTEDGGTVVDFNLWDALPFIDVTTSSDSDTLVVTLTGYIGSDTYNIDYNFQKTSPTTLDLTITSGGSTTPALELIKQ
jgi:hypothetical protein